MKHLILSLTVIQLAALICSGKTVASPAVEIHLASPVDFEVAQRRTRAEGAVTVAGVILPESKDALPVEQLEARLVGTNVSGEWRPLPFDPRVSAFRGELPAPAGGWYRLEARALSHGATVAITVVEHVGVGEVFVIAGQSNSANYGQERQTNHTGMVSAFDGARWRLAGDPEPGAGGKGGSFMPPFGDIMAAQFHVPIGLVAMGIGSTSVREWLPSGVLLTNLPPVTRNVVTVGLGQWEPAGEIFRNFTARLRELGPGGFRAVLWHQGESDSNQANAERTLPGNLYRQYLQRLIEDNRRQIGWQAPWFVALVSYHSPNDMSSPEIRAAQKSLWDAGIALPGPDSDSFTGAMRANNGTGVHLSGDGLRAHGKLWAEKVAPWLEQQLAGH